MTCLDTVKSAFPLTQKIANATLSLNDTLPQTVLDQLADHISTPYADRPSRDSLVMGDPGEQVFVKVQRVETLPKRLRVMLGRPKRSGRYDWPLEELLNTFTAAELGVDTASVVGFGTVRPTLGMVTEFVLMTELLEGHMNGLEWLEANPEQVEAFVRSTFELIIDLHHKGLVHLDLWAANIMVPMAEHAPLRVIDMENGFIRKTEYCSETLGFQLGFFYSRDVCRFIDEARYDELVLDFVGEIEAVSIERFMECYQVSKHEHIGRKQRRKIFLKGEVEVG